MASRCAGAPALWTGAFNSRALSRNRKALPALQRRYRPLAAIRFGVMRAAPRILFSLSFVVTTRWSVSAFETVVICASLCVKVALGSRLAAPW